MISGAVAPGSEVRLDGSMLRVKNSLGNVMGSSIPDVFIPRLIELWKRREFPFDRLSSRPYAFDEINQAILDMEHGDVMKPILLLSYP